MPLAFYRRSTELVAKELLGKKLCRRLSNGLLLSGKIVETEAYVGHKDKGCHAFGGKKTARTQVMFEEGGLAYIYLIYGMYHCLNVVTHKKNCPEAVLIRALEPLDEVDLMKMKSRESRVQKILNGPGKLCKVLEIDKSLNTHVLDSEPLWIEDFENVPKSKIVKSPRINISYAEEWADKALRFTIKDSPFISVKIKP